MINSDVNFSNCNSQNNIQIESFVPSNNPSDIEGAVPIPLSNEPLFHATIPVLNMKEFFDPLLQKKFISELSRALQEVGFFAIANSGIDSTVLDDAYNAAKTYFNLPYEKKIKENIPQNNGQRGFVPGESAKGSKGGDVKEFYHIGRELSLQERERLGYYENVWPDEIDLRSPMVKLFKTLEKEMIPIQRAMAMALGLEDRDYFTNLTTEGDCLLRALYYPKNPPENSMWGAEHTDIDLFTILPRATADGLQVLNNNEEWIDVRVPDGSLIINAGDMLENTTNGKFKSARHRVVAKEEDQERYSMVLFVHPGKDDRLDPLQGCIKDTGGEQKYPNATRWQLLMERLTDLGLASTEMREELSKSGLIERMIQLGRASPKVLQVLEKDGFVNEIMLAELERLRANGSIE